MANKFISGTLILTLSGFVVKAIGSINWIILSRILGGEGIGIYQMAFPIYLLALDISSAGLPIAISIITAEKVAKEDYFGAQRIFHVSLSMLCTTAFVLSVLMFFGSSFLIDEHIIRESRAYYSLIALAPAIFFTTIIAGYRGYLQGWQQMTPTALSQIVEQLVRVVVMLGFAALLLPYGLDYAAGGASLGAGAGGLAAWLVLVYYYYKLKRSLPVDGPVFEQEKIKDILKRLVVLAIPISLSSIMLPVVSNLDLLIVPRRLEVAGYATHQATALFGYPHLPVEHHAPRRLQPGPAHRTAPPGSRRLCHPSGNGPLWLPDRHVGAAHQFGHHPDSRHGHEPGPGHQSQLHPERIR